MRVLKIVALLFFSSICWCQQMNPKGYIYGESVSWVDNSSNCNVSNCWHLGNNTLIKVRSGGGLTVGMLSNHELTVYNDYPTNTWTPDPTLGTSIIDFDVAGNDEIAGITAVTCSGPSSRNVYIMNSNGTGWNETAAGCLTQISYIDSENGSVIAGVNGSGAFYSTNNGASWVNIPAPSGVTWAEMRAISASQFYGIGTNHATYICTPTCTNLNGTLCHIAATPQAVYGLNCSGVVYKFNQTTGVWLQLAGSGFTDITTGGSMMTFAIGPTQSGANVYRYPDAAELHTFTMTGQSGCPPTGCQGVVHTTHMSATESYKGFQGPKHITGTVAPNVNVNDYVSAGTIDPFGCMEGLCNLAHDNGVDCSLAGSDFSNDDGDVITTDHEVAHTKFRSTAGPGSQYDCTTFPMSKVQVCSFPVESWCSNTSFPDYDDGAVQTGMNGPGGGWYPYWEGISWCSRDRLNGVAIGQWDCNTILGRGIVIGTQNASLDYCTYNPY